MLTEFYERRNRRGASLVALTAFGCVCSLLNAPALRAWSGGLPLSSSLPLSRFHRTKAKANICLRQDSIDCSGSRCRSMSYVSVEGGREGGNRGPPVLSIMKASLIERGKEEAGLLAKWRPRRRHESCRCFLCSLSFSLARLVEEHPSIMSM